VRVLNDDVVRRLGVTEEQVESVARAETQELERREREYRGDRPRPDLAGRSVLVVDDGLATGATMRAAAQAVRAAGAGRVVVAVPVGAPDSCRAAADAADEVVCLEQPEAFGAVGAWYDDFAQTTDDEVRSLLSARGTA
jgi:putative phosphoribosyl transferase